MKIKLITVMIVLISGLAGNASGIESLRGMKPLEGSSGKVEVKRVPKDGDLIQRNYVQQPPLIPHKIDGYQINLDFNKCMTCHSWSRYKETGATKISQTHFKDRNGVDLATVSARRYFCTQCHVPQANAKPLVENTFKPVEAISR